MRIVRNDKVMVISGKGSKGTKDANGKKLEKAIVGKVLSVDPKGGKLIVEGVNVHKRHQRPRKQGEEGGIIDAPAPIYASKVMLVCPKCNKPTRVGVKYLDNGDKVRYCKAKDGCGAVISVIKKAKKGE